STQFTFTPGALSAAEIHAGSEIQIMNSYRWASQIDIVKSVDLVHGIVTLQTPLNYANDDGTTFRVLNVAADVHNDKDFAWRASDGKLVVDVASTTELQNVEVSRAATLFNLNGASNVTIEGFTFENVTHDGQAINIYGGSGNKIDQNSFI